MKNKYAYIKINKYSTQLVVLTRVQDDWHSLFSRDVDISLTHSNYEEEIELHKLIKTWMTQYKDKFKKSLGSVAVIIDDALNKRFAGSKLQYDDPLSVNPQVVSRNWTNIIVDASSANDSCIFFIEPLGYRVGDRVYEDFPFGLNTHEVFYNYIECVLNREHYLKIEGLCNYLNLKLNLILPNYVAHQTYLAKKYPHIGNYVNVDINNNGTAVHVSKNYLCEGYSLLPFNLRDIINAVQIDTQKDLSIVHQVLKNNYAQWVMPNSNNFNHQDKYINLTTEDADTILETFNNVFLVNLQKIEQQLTAISGNTPIPLIYTGDISKVAHIEELVQRNSHYEAYVDNRPRYLNFNKYVHFSFLGAAFYQISQQEMLASKTLPKNKNKKMKLFKRIPHPGFIAPTLPSHQPFISANYNMTRANFNLDNTKN